MGILIRVTGVKIFQMGRASKNLQTATFMKDNSLMEKRAKKEYIYGKTILNLYSIGDSSRITTCMGRAL